MVKKIGKVEGVIYSLPLEIAMNVFQKGRSVFVKYTPHEPTKKTENRLDKNMKLFIYISKSNKSVIGEATIKEISYLDLEEMLRKYKNKIMISEAELYLYAEGRERKRAQVLELKNIVLYPREIPVKVPVTMGGVYVTKENKKNVFGKTK
jgi:hypothetical protein